MDMNSFFYRLDKLFEAKKLEEVEVFLKENLEAAEKEKDLGAVISICNELGGYYRAFSRFNEGIKLYERALECIEGLGLNNTEHHGTTLINYATTNTMTGDTQKALDLYTKAAEIFSGAGYKMDYRLATLYNNMSFLCQDLGQLEKGEECLQSALYILKSLDESQIEIAITYTNLANIYMAMDKLAESKVEIKKALDIFIEESGGSDVHYSASVCSLGEIYYKENEYEKALALFKEALALTKRDYGTETLSYAVLLGNMARCEEKLGMDSEAAEHSSISTEIRERIKP